MSNATTNLEQLLQGHDWFYEYSDDNGVWRRGNERHNQILREMRTIGEPAATELWNRYAPDRMKRQVLNG